MIVATYSGNKKLYYTKTIDEGGIVIHPDKKKAYVFKDTPWGLELAAEVAGFINGHVEERPKELQTSADEVTANIKVEVQRSNEEMLAIAQEKRWIRCTYEEMLDLVEFLFLHDSGFEVTEVDCSKNECTLFLK